MDVDAPELRALDSYYRRVGGALWIAGDGDGMIATRPSFDTMWEICRVYVKPALHGTGLASTLLTTAESYAFKSGAAEFELWTDTRFTRAHRFYEKHGYRKQPEQRTLVETDGPVVEFRYRKTVG